jgi:hypothetical protein
MDDTSDLSIAMQLARYQKYVIEYESLGHQIQALINRHGTTDKMPKTEFDRYRLLARQRDDVQNDMMRLQQRLNLDENDTP